ncbi:MAG TPA: winged helix-turn-helix domain-containing protein, partial [Brevibacterium sp.]|nr:winged helix-turn-helix domain-containing protein [Brevibacterium sp.]
RPREIRARIEAMLRRPRVVVTGNSPPETTAPAETPAGDAEPDGLLTHGELRVDRDARVVELGGSPLDLTRSEFDILATLLENPRRVLTKSQLARALWTDSYDVGVEPTEADHRSIEVHVAKLGDLASAPR